MSRNLGAVVSPAIERDELYAACHRAWVAVQDAERVEAVTSEKAEKAREAADRKRLDLGRALIAKKAAAKHGTWGPTLKDLGISEATAWRYMKFAGYEEERAAKSFTNEDVKETAATYRDAGIDNRPRKSEQAQAPALAVIEPESQSPMPWADDLGRLVEGMQRDIKAAFAKAQQIEALCEQHRASVTSPALLTTRSMLAGVKAAVADVLRKMEGSDDE